MTTNRILETVEKIGKKTPAGLAGLKTFVARHTDGSRPQFFAGRRKIIANIEDACSLSWEYHSAGYSQLGLAIRHLYGAPGAGKTSTLVHLQDEWAQGFYITKNSDGTKRKEPAPAMLYSGCGGVLDSIETFCIRLVELVEPAIGDDKLTAICETIRAIASREGLLVQDQTESEKAEELAVALAGLAVVAKVLPRDRWKRPVVIGVDEVQNLHGNKHSPVGRLLQQLHADKQDLPVILVLAGRSDSVTRVQKLGLSRLSRGHICSLDGLDRQEVEELKQEFCSYFQISLGKQEIQFDHMLSATHGWPYHIQNFLFSFAKHYIDAEGDIENVDFSQVELESLRLRTDYFYDRLSDEIRESMILLSSVMKKLTSPLASSNVIDIIEQKSKLAKYRTEKLPRGMTPEDYFDHLRHCGVLEQSKRYSVTCPIPSFRQFLITLPD